MIKVRVTYICDACGKRHVENLELSNDYLDVGEAIESSDLPYTPEGWSVDVFSDDSDAEQRLLCKKCTKGSEEFHGNDNRVVCDIYPWNEPKTTTNDK